MPSQSPVSPSSPSAAELVKRIGIAAGIRPAPDQKEFAIGKGAHRNALQRLLLTPSSNRLISRVLGSDIAQIALSCTKTWPSGGSLGDGAVAVVLCSRDPVDRLDIDPLLSWASMLASGADDAPPAAARAAKKAYETAGIVADYFDVVELHDAAAAAALTSRGGLALAEPTGGTALLDSGSTGLAGRYR